MDKEINGVNQGWKYVVFDLDGTLAEPVWPARGKVGEPIEKGIALLFEYWERGWYITIDSARRKIDEPVVWEWVKKHKLPVDQVRCGRKLVADEYVDDRAVKFERQ